jgi:hypothetical protein
MLYNHIALPLTTILTGGFILLGCIVIIVIILHKMVQQLSCYHALIDNKTILETALAEFDILMDLSSPYFNNFKLKAWLEKYNSIFTEVIYFKRKIESEDDEDIASLKKILFS